MISGNVVWDNVRGPAEALLGLSCPIKGNKDIFDKSLKLKDDSRKVRKVLLKLYFKMYDSIH